ncbi:nacht and ankyrin domain containing protein [Neofusicoccum parvum]|uniref:Nacht and ankyrin domain containing protein n=1 Tax=Neofusicoccum parvum TaxID=310453 RepID=A0ACB5SQC2_9PEZI|nr:nacht and ankyrin domain containing protein [Neofusicoccum parvum]
MSISNYATYRLHGIPKGSSRKDVRTLVRRAVRCDDDSNIRVGSLANELSEPGEMVATLSFDKTPEVLSGSSTAEQWRLEVPLDEPGEAKVVLLFDTHFHGCTTLHCPPGEDWKMDLIAISGLGGHAFGSFKRKGESYMWLRDDLPKSFPGSRVIIYGYNSKLHGSLSVQNATDIAMKFHEAMTDIRSVPEKPLLLLGHSLGGIVIKEALHMIRTSDDQVDKVNFGAISGILFFGVPNQGMDIQSLIPMAGDGFNRGFLHTLESQSPVLRTQAQQWSQTDADLNCNIINFYETQASLTARLKDDGTWTMAGPPAVLVDSHSATHGRLRNLNGHRIHPIDCSHSDLVKFSSVYDEAYKTVLRYLRSVDAEIGQRRNACLKSLGFPEQYDRMDSLDPDDRTCDWLIKNKVFASWLNSPKGLIWIRGNPGSGKSMAMKRALLYFKD